MKQKLHKCATKDCDIQIEVKYKFCSIECACYAGKCSVKLIKEKNK